MLNYFTGEGRALAEAGHPGKARKLRVIAGGDSAVATGDHQVTPHSSHQGLMNYFTGEGRAPATTRPSATASAVHGNPMPGIWHVDVIEYASHTRISPRPSPRVRSHCRFILPLIHFIPDSLAYSVLLFLTRRSDRTRSPLAKTPVNFSV
jgi:hypothetical protein